MKNSIKNKLYLSLLLVTATAIVPVFILMTGLVQAQSAGAVLSFSPTDQTIKVGDTLSTTIRLNTNGEQIDRVLVRITYPSNLLRAQSVDQTDSFVNLWYQNDIKTAGQITLEGGVSTTPVSGTSTSPLTFAKINFATLGEGSAQFVFANESAVYRDSDGSNILTSGETVTYTISSVTPTPIPTYGLSATPSPSTAPSNTTGTPTTSPGPGTGTLAPTISKLPEGGTTIPTLIFVAGAVILSFAGFSLLRKT